MGNMILCLGLHCVGVDTELDMHVFGCTELSGLFVFAQQCLDQLRRHAAEPG